MKNSTCSASTCGHCCYFAHHGRRGGQCQQLNVSVSSRWKACSLAAPPFTPTWQRWERLLALPPAVEVSFAQSTRGSTEALAQ